MAEKADVERKSYDSLLSDLSKDKVLGLFLDHLKKEHNFSEKEILDTIQKDDSEIMIPVGIFNEKLSSLESIIKYLVENLEMKNKDIARLLGRNIRTTWTTYNNAKKKFSKKIIVIDNVYSIPVSRFTDRRFSVLEIIVTFLRERYHLSFHNIAVLLKRHDSTILTVYHRAKKKKE